MVTNKKKAEGLEKQRPQYTVNRPFSSDGRRYFRGNQISSSVVSKWPNAAIMIKTGFLVLDIGSLGENDDAE